MTGYAEVVIPVPLRRTFTYAFDDSEADVRAGMRVTVPFGQGNRKLRGYVVGTSFSAPDGGFEVKKIIRTLDKAPVFSEQEYSLALWMENFYFSSRGIVMDTIVPGGKRDVPNPVFSSEDVPLRSDVELTASQQSAVRAVLEGSSSMYYLFGITGSGKTEVFLRCAEEVIASGGQVIYLVPEITLTHQLAKQVVRRFRDNVAVLHSGLTPAQRITQWRRIKNGEVGLVIGARSAVFAPCPNLKLIIIDEEHEYSYKSSNDPRYHARQVAQHRIAQCGGKLLMGSATPSLEAWSMMKEGKIDRLDLTERVGGGRLPEIVVSDMNREKAVFGKELIALMNGTLAAGKQVILFLNRRGFSYAFHCRNCGYELKCPDCDVTMTYHRHTGTLVCHYCGHSQKPVRVCPVCGSLDVLYSGFGTEHVEQQVAKLFPDFRCARIDTDMVSSDRNLIARTFEAFRKGDIQILIGTQMVAKGLDFPNVALVGIVLADSGLLVPDFRSEERTFDLLVQVSGRSGRASDGGKVVIQTRMKNNASIQYAREARVEAFLDRELEIRKSTCFPPFSRMVNIVFRASDRKKVYRCAEEVAQKLRSAGTGYEVFGAQECAVERVRNKWRFQVLLRSRNPGCVFAALRRVLPDVSVPSSVIMEVDVDPLEMF